MSNALTLAWGAFFTHNVLWWNWPSGKSFSSIKLTKSMALAVDGISLFYTSLSGAMLWSLFVGFRCGFHLQAFYIWLHRETSITTLGCLSLSRFQRATENCIPSEVVKGPLCLGTRFVPNVATRIYLWRITSLPARILLCYLHNLVWNGPSETCITLST